MMGMSIEKIVYHVYCSDLNGAEIIQALLNSQNVQNLSKEIFVK